MPQRRPRCTCGDLFSEHDWRDQSLTVTDPCRGPVCSALSRLHHHDFCDVYLEESPAYRPLTEVLPAFGLTMQDVRSG